MTSRTLASLFCAGTLGILAVPAVGQVWVSGDTTSTDSAANWAFGHKFTVTGTQVVTALGVFVGGGEPASTVQVRLFNFGSGIQVPGGSQDFGPGATPVGSYLMGSYRFQNLLTPVSLTPGTYVLSYWSDGTQKIGDTNNGNTAPSFASLPGMTYDGDYYAGGTGDVAPNVTPYGTSVLKGPNMLIPEPEMYALVVGLGLVGYGLYFRRQHQRN